jgi:uncharacterized integral membrane protein
MKSLFYTLQQVLLLFILVGGCFFAYLNRESVTINFPYFAPMELPLWLICFVAAFIGFLACFLIMRSVSIAHAVSASTKKTISREK